MFGNNFYNRSLRKHIVLFGTLFNEIYIERMVTDGDTSEEQIILVPISYSPKEKMLSRLTADPDIDRNAAIILPRMSFEITGAYYDAARALSSSNQICFPDSSDPDAVSYTYTPSPWNFNIQLYIYTKYAEDGTKILEQILPYFTPEWTVSAQLADDVPKNFDIPVVIQGASIEDTYEGAFNDRRAIIWTLDFLVKGWIFGPVKTGSQVIKLANIHFFEQQSNNSLEKLVVYPGLDANGAPTTNAAVTIPYANIDSTDDYAFIVEIQEGE